MTTSAAAPSERIRSIVTAPAMAKMTAPGMAHASC